MFAEMDRQQLATVNEEVQSIDFDPKRREEAQAEYLEAGNNVTALEARINQGTLTLQRETDNLERDLEDARNAQTQLGPSHEALNTLQNRINSEDYAHDAHAQASELESAISKLQYDAEEHAAVNALVSQLGKYSDLHRSLRDASERPPSEQELLSAATKELSRSSEELIFAQKRRTEVQQALLGLPASEVGLREAQVNLTGIESRLDNQRVKTGVLESQIQRWVEVE